MQNDDADDKQRKILRPRGKAREPAFLQERIDWYYRERVHNTWGGTHIMHGREPGADAVMLMSNDYLSVANHPRIVEAQTEALQASGNGLLMSAVFVHGDDPLLHLEQKFARWLGSETAVLSQSGWCANTGLIQSIAGDGIPVYIDMMAHMSLHEGVCSAGAKPVPFRHNDAENLERQIRRRGSGVVIVDSVYSTSGSVAPIEDIVGVARAYDCVVVVDESHSLGTHGSRGEGLVASLGLSDQVHFRTASLAKAFAGRAGLITCNERFSEYFRSTARPAIFSSTLVPHEIAGLSATLDVIRDEGWRRERLARNAALLREGLSELGYNVTSSQSQIVPLEAGPEPATMRLRDALESRGVFGSVFCAPATAHTRSLVRLSINAGLTQPELERVIAACAAIRGEIDVANWPSTKRLARRTKAASVAA